MAYNNKPVRRGSKGFRKTSGLVENSLRKAGESRGFAMTRLLTHWEDVLGPDMAAQCTPVKVSYAQRGFGATLTILTTGSYAPMLTMQVGQIRDRVNACYGYNAISRVKITQTAPHGFKAFASKPAAAPKRIDPQTQAAAHQAASQIQDPTLRDVLNQFGANVMTKEGRT
ncbi:MAG: DUF721 domain-containing protein [Planktomarina sp.]